MVSVFAGPVLAIRAFFLQSSVGLAACQVRFALMATPAKAKRVFMLGVCIIPHPVRMLMLVGTTTA